MVRTILSKKQEQPIFLSLSPQKINAVNVNSGHIHNTQCLQQVNIFSLEASLLDQIFIFRKIFQPPFLKGFISGIFYTGLAGAYSIIM